MINTRSGAVEATLPSGTGPFNVATSPTDNSAYVADLGRATSSSSTRARAEPPSTVALGSYGTDPFNAAATRHAIYVTNQGANTLSVTITAIRRARELGVNFFDTAQAYGFGASERLLGKALRDELTRNRDRVAVATKGALRMTDSALVRDASPEWLRQGVDASLTALGIDHIDLYQVHWPDPKVPATETAGALREHVAEGKIGDVGVSNYDAQQIAEFAATLAVETAQPP